MLYLSCLSKAGIMYYHVYTAALTFAGLDFDETVKLFVSGIAIHLGSFD